MTIFNFPIILNIANRCTSSAKTNARNGEAPSCIPICTEIIKALSKETRNKLAEMGKKTQTFDEIVTNLIAKSNEPSGEVVAGENNNE